MYIVRYRTHGPWQQETFPERIPVDNGFLEGWVEAYNRSVELAKSFTEVRYERVSDMIEWKDGKRGEWHDD